MKIGFATVAWLMVFTVVGCVPSNLNGSGSSREASEALRLAKENVRNGYYDVALDYALASIRLDTSGFETYSNVLAFCNDLALSQDNVAFEVASAIHARLEAMIPFLSVNKIAGARKSYELSRPTFELPAIVRVGSPSEDVQPIETLALPSSNSDTGLPQLQTLKHHVSQIAESDAPAETKALALDNVRYRLTMLEAELCLRSKLEESATIWSDLATTGTQINELESLVMSELYKTVQADFLNWKSSADDLVKRSENVDNDSVLKVSAELKQTIELGEQRHRDIFTYANASIASAKSDLSLCAHSIERLQRAREWLYNQQALRRVVAIVGSQYATIEKLRDMAKIDEPRLMPYVAKRFEEEWNKLFEECSEDQKILAVRYRVFGKFSD
ncbi:MAG: hypothetical protein HUU29_05255 [Planctomycetaceae bacterium]|nr:hypothetical protein [Planctomycetaceae bacterium]